MPDVLTNSTVEVCAKRDTSYIPVIIIIIIISFSPVA